ncbi:ABC transporter substrate-binding protein [Ferrovibrio sp.]|uniref:ABC transporter substrate-binding protein n=1 Tax=Ferrovibrio sp. TaxID=1917215 RepID=UPI001B577503|nr:ABC transporter substrate-binding protein [Ferrovibrio sp.]MBP7066253.1 ABC transporter substrate-binding protein [Ferrovibrio sp.]
MRVKYLLATAAAVLTAGAANAQVTDGIIKLGVMNDQSGLYADVSGPGGTWAAKKAVADSGIEARGFKVEVVFADHQNKPDIGSNVARQWYDVDKVDAIVDVPTSSVALAINNITKEKNKVFIGSGPASSDLTGPACSPNTAHWTYDTWALANGTGKAIVQTGGKSWYFVTADYAFGHALERDTSNVVKANGGTVTGAVRHPFPGTDFSSFLLQAQASKAQIVAFANAGGDTINSIKQAAEFGIVEGGQKLAGMLMFITDVHSLGLKTAQGLNFTTAWYWDANDNNRAFAKEFAAANGGKMPTMVHAGIYSGVIHYLKAVEALKSDADGVKVVDKMKEMPSDDKLFGKGVLRKDGRHVHDMYLVEVKKPSESKYAWDYLTVKKTIPAAEAFRPMADGNCPLVK